MSAERVFGPEDWRRWFDGQARAVFGLSAEEFVAAYRRGEFARRPVADDLASVIPLCHFGEATT